METKMVRHKNWLGHEINESLLNHADDIFDREIYCRKTHTIKVAEAEECYMCPFYEDAMQGHGICCTWKDIESFEYDVKHEDRYREYERVDKLMKRGILEHFEDDLIAKVKDGPFDKLEWVYQQSEDRKARYLLGKFGEKTLICCGVNPSYASPGDLDPTMRKVEAIAKRNGYDSFVMINLYPMRATNPKDLHKTMDEKMAQENQIHIRQILARGNCEIWAAWGTLVESRKYLKECLEKIVEIAEDCQCRWCTFGDVTKAGHPRHPLFLNQKSEKVSFDIKAYVEQLK